MLRKEINTLYFGLKFNQSNHQLYKKSSTKSEDKINNFE